MTLFRTMPTFDSFYRELNRLHRDLETNVGRSWIREGNFPALNIWEDDDHVYLESELPGFQITDLEIYVAGADQLTIKGERKPTEHSEAVCHRQERSFGSFTRSVTLPVAVDANKVEAKLEQGVLHLKMAKSPTAKPKKISITV